VLRIRRRNGFEIASWKGAARKADHQSGAKHTHTNLFATAMG
jgi:hypothetical protein